MFSAAFIYFFVAFYVFWWLANNICDRCSGLLSAWLFYGNIFLVSLSWPITLWYIMVTGTLPFAFGRQPPRSPEEIRELFTPTSYSGWDWAEPVSWRTRSHGVPPAIKCPVARRRAK